MYTNPYLLWNMYHLMRTMHGTYWLCAWFVGATSATILWSVSFVYTPYELKQITDKEQRKQIKLNGID